MQSNKKYRRRVFPQGIILRIHCIKFQMHFQTFLIAAQSGASVSEKETSCIWTKTMKEYAISCPKAKIYPGPALIFEASV